MKTINKYFVWFALLFTIYTVLFRYFLSNSLNKHEFSLLWLYAIVYGILIIVTSWYLGKADGIKNFLFNSGFRFHFTSYVIWGVVSELWFVLGFSSKYESVSTVHLTLLFWGLGVLLHFIISLILRKNTIKGIHKSDVFN